MNPPRVAITLGDVNGVGPEVVARALQDETVRNCCRPVVVGPPDVLRRAFDLIGAANEVVERDGLVRSSGEEAGIGCVDPARELDVPAVSPGRTDAAVGRMAYESVVTAAKAALAGAVDAIVTAPLNKAALKAAGVEHPGHTELLAELCGVEAFAMMLHVPPGDCVRGAHGLSVAHVTLHTSMASVPGLLTVDAVRSTIELVHGFAERLGCASPRVGVCALNPHAGERGLFGDEEARTIGPAVESAAESGRNVTGPFPADTLFRRAVAGEFDGVVAMYHDQGHIALKLIAFDEAVNVTLGLPIVRTSPSQGTAYDIAWQGRARPEGMIGAIRLAAQLATSRAERPA